jgi:hypothetical protein
MCSLAVVIISLLEPFGVKLSTPPNAVNLVCAAISLLILVVSLLVSGYKYGERAEKMHTGAIEINSVARRLETAIDKSEALEIERLTDEYEGILKIYENHKDVDYKVAQIKRYATYYGIKPYHKIWWLHLQWDIVPHTLPLFITGFFIWLVTRGAHL